MLELSSCSRMKLHLLSTFICLILASVISDAALPPELYWKSKLPNTTIPKAVKDLLREGKRGKAIYDDSNNKLLTWRLAANDQFRDDPNNWFFDWWRAANDQLHNKANKQLRSYWSTATNQLHDGLSKYLFLSEDDLNPGKKLEMLFTKSPYSTTLLPREVAETIPFSVEEVPELLKMFSIKPGSKEAHTIKSTIHRCHEPPVITEEEKRCVTSLESMVDYIISKLGTNVKAYSTGVEKETQFQTYTVAPVVKISDEVTVCHQTHYPYALFHCHKVGGSNRAYFVPLEGSDGTRVKAIVVCHLDTSGWDPNHLAFQVLKIKPGTAPVCHFSPTDNIIWTPIMAT